MRTIPCNCPKGGIAQHIPLPVEDATDPSDPWLVYHFSCAVHGSWTVRSRTPLDGQDFTPERVAMLNREHQADQRDHKLL